MKDSSRKPTENKLPKEEKAPPKAAFKEPKLAVKETKLENTSPKGGPQPELKSSSKRPSNVESPKPSAKKQKKSSSKGVKNILGTSPRTSSSSYPEKKQTKEKMNAKVEKVKSESEAKEIKKPVEMEESNSEDETSFKSEVSRDLFFTTVWKDDVKSLPGKDVKNNLSEKMEQQIGKCLGWVASQIKFFFETPVDIKCSSCTNFLRFICRQLPKSQSFRLWSLIHPLQ